MRIELLPITMKKNAQALNFQHVDHQVEHREEDEAPTGAVQHERARPEILVDREVEVPEPREGERDDAGGDHGGGFVSSR